MFRFNLKNNKRPLCLQADSDSASPGLRKYPCGLKILRPWRCSAEPEQGTNGWGNSYPVAIHIFSQTIVLHVALYVLFILSLPKG